MDSNKHFLNEVPEALLHFPQLQLREREDGIILSGQLLLKTLDDEILDIYEIEIHPSVNYPNSYPLVYEVGGRIPKNIDWHVYSSGECCLAVPAEERLECLAGINLTTFIKKQVLGYFFNQTFRRNNGYFYRERAHGLPGKLEYYQELLCLKDIATTIVAVQRMAIGPEQGSHSKCFCGSKRKFKKCHRRKLRLLGHKAGDIIRHDYRELKNLISKLKDQESTK